MVTPAGNLIFMCMGNDRGKKAVYKAHDTLTVRNKDGRQSKNQGRGTPFPYND